ncbi:MAG: hypothetical protein ABL974_04775 [Prosthecobacter sp.]
MKKIIYISLVWLVICITGSIASYRYGQLDRQIRCVGLLTGVQITAKQLALKQPLQSETQQLLRVVENIQGFEREELQALSVGVPYIPNKKETFDALGLKDSD